MKRITSTAALFAAGFLQMATAASTAESRLTQAYARIDRALAAAPIPGLVVGITDRTKLSKVLLHGFADLKAKTPVRADTLFAIGSISKSFTALALMQMRDEGTFDPQRPVSHYLPWFKVDSTSPPILGHHLLTHTAGLPSYRAELSSSSDAAYALRDFEPTYAPGTHFWYSNLGFQILGYVIEAIEPAPYHSVIERRVFERLAMKSSVAMIDDSQRTHLAVSYVRWPYDGSYREAPWFEYSAADGSIASTIGDMAAYARLYLNQGDTPHGRLISEDSFRSMTTPVLESYAYGLTVTHPDGDTIIGHAGSIAGFHSFFEAHLKDGFAVVLLGNAEFEPALTQWIIDTVAAAEHNTPFPEPPKPPAPESIDPARYSGVYKTADGDALEFAAGTEGGLTLQQCGARVPLIPMGADQFRTPTANTNASLFLFAPEGSDATTVGGVSHGPGWFVKEGRSPARVAPIEWAAYVGHYENHNPEGPSARIYIRDGRLWALLGGEVPETGSQPLEPVGAGAFRPASPAYNPERLQFGTIIDGRALRMTFSGTPLYRVDTQ